jgi:hypothetical protein
MSLAVNGNISPVLSIDPRLEFDNSGNFAVTRGGVSVTYRTLPSQNYSSGGQNTVFNVQPPNQNIAISRKLLTKFYYQVVITAVAGASGNVVDLGIYDAPRFMPTQQTTSSMSATINNANVNLIPYQLVQALACCNLSDMNLGRDWSLAPSHPDEFQNYSDVYTVPQFLGTVADPLQSLGESTTSIPNRGGWAVSLSGTNNVGVGVTGTVTLQFSSTEPILVSPFSSVDDSHAFIGVQTLTLSIQQTLNGGRTVWSHSDSVDASTITNMVTSLYAPPEVQSTYLTPSPLYKIPHSVVYNYSNVDIYTTDTVASISSGADFTVSTNNVQLNTIPKRILFFARVSDSATNYTTTDTFAWLKQMQIQFDNVSGIFGGSSPEQLYMSAREQGYDKSWTQWSSTTGSVMILDLGRNMALQNSSDAAGLQASKQLQITATFNNINKFKALPFTIFVIVISDGLITISGNTTIQQNSVLTREDILNAHQGTAVTSYHAPATYWGGNVFKKLVHGLRKNKVLSTGAEVASILGVPHAHNVARVARATGFGLVSQDMEGGRMMRKSALKRRVMHGRGLDADEEEEEYEELM